MTAYYSYDRKELVLTTLEDLLIRVLGKWCSRCKRVTQPYLSEDNRWPCCNGCWHVYPE